LFSSNHSLLLFFFRSNKNSSVLLVTECISRIYKQKRSLGSCVSLHLDKSPLEVSPLDRLVVEVYWSSLESDITKVWIRSSSHNPPLEPILKMVLKNQLISNWSWLWWITTFIKKETTLRSFSVVRLK
jgi:hypothetical protein